MNQLRILQTYKTIAVLIQVSCNTLKNSVIFTHAFQNIQTSIPFLQRTPIPNKKKKKTPNQAIAKPKRSSRLGYMSVLVEKGPQRLQMPEYPADLGRGDRADDGRLAVDALLLDAAHRPDGPQYPADVEVEAAVLGRELLQGRVSVRSGLLG